MLPIRVHIHHWFNENTTKKSIRIIECSVNATCIHFKRTRSSFFLLGVNCVDLRSAWERMHKQIFNAYFIQNGKVNVLFSRLCVVCWCEEHYQRIKRNIESTKLYFCSLVDGKCVNWSWRTRFVCAYGHLFRSITVSRSFCNIFAHEF